METTNIAIPIEYWKNESLLFGEVELMETP